MGHGCVKPDPAIERFNQMREGAYLNFRWTSRTTRTALYGFIVVPALLYYITDLTNQRWDWNGKRKGQALSIKGESSL